MAEYVYGIASDFNNNTPTLSKLSDEILSVGLSTLDALTITNIESISSTTLEIITITYIDINTTITSAQTVTITNSIYTPSVICTFSASLTNSQTTTLTNVIWSHVPEQEIILQNPVPYNITVSCNISQLSQEFQNNNIPILNMSYQNNIVIANYLGLISKLHNDLAILTITNHIADFTPPLVKTSNISFEKKRINVNSYTVLTKFIFNGPTYIKLTINSYMDSTLTSYSIRLYDKTNSILIGEKTFTNKNEMINTMGPYQLPNNGESIIEIQAKRTGTSSAYIESIIAKYA